MLRNKLAILALLAAMLLTALGFGISSRTQVVEADNIVVPADPCTPIGGNPPPSNC